MEDSEILDLYFARDEKAITESDRKYGILCRTVAERILHSSSDSEECVSDTWLRAWNVIPPEQPKCLAAFFAKITRNIALDRWRNSHAQKNGSGAVEVCFEEMKTCFPADTEIDPADRLLIRDLLNRFLRGLPAETREIFLLRYWYFCTNAEIAERTGKSRAAVKILLHRTREGLRKFLEKEGIHP